MEVDGVKKVWQWQGWRRVLLGRITGKVVGKGRGRRKEDGAWRFGLCHEK